MIYIRIGFIGAGKVGFSFGKYFIENNINVSGYYSKSFNSSKEASIFTNTKHYLDLENLVKESDIIFITTEDRNISLVFESLKQLSINNKILCHCSGSLSSDIFSNISKYKAYGYSIHPLFVISDKYNSYKNLKESYITIEGNEKYLNYFKELFEGLGNKVQIISKQDKILYHLSAVISSNLVTGLINKSLEYLKKCDFSEEDSLRAIKPLVEFNINNIFKKGVTESLTGPVERGDCVTLENHMVSIDNKDLQLYKLLSKNILNIAKLKNCNRDYENIERLLK